MLIPIKNLMHAIATNIFHLELCTSKELLLLVIILGHLVNEKHAACCTDFGEKLLMLNHQ